MNAHEIGIALTGRSVAERALKTALRILIVAEERALLTQRSDAHRKVIVEEAQTFYLWDDVRRFGDSNLYFEGLDPTDVKDMVFEYETAPGGFTLRADVTDDRCEIFLPAEVVDIAARGDDQAMLRYVRADIEKMMVARKDRREKIRARFAAEERAFQMAADDEKQALLELDARTNEDNGPFKGPIELYNRLLTYGMVTDLGGYPVVTSLGNNILRRMRGGAMIEMFGIRELREAREAESQ